MLDYLLFALTFVIFLIIVVIYLYPGSKKSTTIPGPEPVDTLEGNYPDITSCGSLHEFLLKIHEDYGPIASFWAGPQLCVSLASPLLLKEKSNIFDRPAELFKAPALLWGDNSFFLQNGSEGRQRYASYCNALNIQYVNQYLKISQKCINELTSCWASWPRDQYLPLFEQISTFVVKSLICSLFGLESVEEKELATIKLSLENCWNEVDHCVNDMRDVDGQREKRLSKYRENLTGFVKKILLANKKEATGKNCPELIKAALKLSETIAVDDLMTLLCDGYYKSSSLLTWMTYLLALNTQIQKNLAKELQSINIKDSNYLDLTKLPYLEKVYKETLRYANIVPYTARYQEFDTVVGGHKIPSGTPVIHAIGVIYQSKEFFNEPDDFNPDRSEFNKDLPNNEYLFEPFGFSGKRVCPGQKLMLAQATLFMSEILFKFELNITSEQGVFPHFGFYSKPNEEIYISIKNLKKI